MAPLKHQLRIWHFLKYDKIIRISFHFYKEKMYIIQCNLIKWQKLRWILKFHILFYWSKKVKKNICKPLKFEGLFTEATIACYFSPFLRCFKNHLASVRSMSLDANWLKGKSNAIAKSENPSILFLYFLN